MEKRCILLIFKLLNLIISAKEHHLPDEKYKKEVKNQSKVVKSSFIGSNITKYSGLNTVAKYLSHNNIVSSISPSFPTEWHNTTKYGVNQLLMAITLASISGISRICRITVFDGDGLVKTFLRLDKAINENAISSTLKNLGQSGIAIKAQSVASCVHF